ncbi:uncharacterized protein Z518_10433 [Rhinocladiella mackenziei CBS 650.93]|uniref:Fungal N-terminal domain-containing protein n=1 Tax=Rhinocladiella mackenziei CBS 650.93 TaxID=1442369 RepID=A0A0D2I3E4_9EURO|nr:uncharacterized protein Z518_10433 [Rhinocladiella mackenziei CBS 650.93]KIX00294.1 hypothetical protein Z518_10433 [Rhinocladiella mackenziei CBS 650.93]
MAAGLGETASIAGIVSLVLQSIEAITAINDFCRAYKAAHGDVLRASQDLELLQQVLIQTKNAASSDMIHSKCPSNQVTCLRNCVSRCQQDLGSWISLIRQLETSNIHGIHRVWKKIKIAADGKKFNSITIAALMHTQRINTCLQLIDCGLELDIHTEVYQLGSRVVDLTNITNTLRSEISDNFDALSDTFRQHHIRIMAAVSSVKTNMRHLSARADANAAAVHASQHVFQQMSSKLLNEFRKVQAQIADHRKSTAQQFSLASASQLDTNTQLSTLQINQILSQCLLSPCLDNHLNLRRIRFRFAKQNLGKFVGFSDLFLSPRLKAWSRATESALVAIQCHYAHRVEAQAFGVAMVESLAKESIPVIWVMNSTRKDNISAETLATYALRSLIQQALIRNSQWHTEATLGKICASLSYAESLRTFLEILKTVLRGLPLIYLIIDAQPLYTPDLQHEWPTMLLDMLQTINTHDSHSPTIVKILLMNYHTKTIWRPVEPAHKEMIIWKTKAATSDVRFPHKLLRKDMLEFIRGQSKRPVAKF